MRNDELRTPEEANDAAQGILTAGLQLVQAAKSDPEHIVNRVISLPYIIAILRLDEASAKKLEPVLLDPTLRYVVVALVLASNERERAGALIA